MCFQYDYDEKGRVIWKKAPGAQPLRMLYDARDRVVFMQDGNQAAMSPAQWTVNLYDALDRQVATLHYTTSETATALQTALDNAPASATVTITAAGAPTTTLTLSLCSITANLNNTAFTRILKYQFYDNYTYGGAKAFNTAFTNTTAYSTSDPNVQPITRSNRTINYPTGTVTRVLGTNTFLTATDFYDENGAHIQTVEDNMLYETLPNCEIDHDH
ncbi:MAG: hypothetical protein K2X48_13780 [Chitinophagaceae bacterium]|nr:hypothetical protein [Chitinophagaceae bacterium]